ncbi:MAG: exodeoxyribonuclease III [Acidimicrobiales bacterium]
MRIVTWNVNSLKARLERVEEWLTNNEPDIVCLQETKLADDAFPAITFAALGYEAFHHGEGRWNGVAILSRVGLDDPQAGFTASPGDDVFPGEARVAWATCGGVRVASVYVPNGREVDHDHYAYKLRFLGRLRTELEATSDPSADVAICGDFNIAPDDRDVYDPAAFVGATHVSAPERAALAELEAWGLSDVFRRHYDDGGLYSWWDYRAGNFHKGKGMRIDLVLASAPFLAQRSTAALIDRNARKGKAPSDHASRRRLRPQEVLHERRATPVRPEGADGVPDPEVIRGMLYTRQGAAAVDDDHLQGRDASPGGLDAHHHRAPGRHRRTDRYTSSRPRTSWPGWR